MQKCFSIFCNFFNNSIKRKKKGYLSQYMVYIHKNLILHVKIKQYNNKETKNKYNHARHYIQLDIQYICLSTFTSCLFLLSCCDNMITFTYML